MPSKTIEEIQALVVDGDITAITLDTSIFDQFECNLGYKSLTALKQFKDTGIKVLFTPITMGEVKAHIATAAKEKAGKLTAAINQFDKAWRKALDQPAIAAQLGLDNDPAARADELVGAFLKEVGAELIPLEDNVSIDDLVDLYFAGKAPFSEKEDKKNEFPDAIALLALESWADDNGTVLIISRDGDWQAFADTSSNLICVKDLPKGLDLFNGDSRVMAAKVVDDLRNGQSPKLHHQIKRALEYFAEDFTIEAFAAHFYDEEIQGAEVRSWEVQAGNVNVVASDDDTFTVLIAVDAEIEFNAHFSFYHYDGVDRDYVPLGGTNVSTTKSEQIQVAIAVDRNDLDDPEPVEVEVETSLLTVYIGEVEPDWA